MGFSPRLYWAILCLLTLLPGPALAQTPAPAPAQPQAKADPFRPADIVFSGKLYSPVKLSVTLPFTAQILQVRGQIGQEVKKGDVLAKYEIPLETRMEEKNKLSPAQIKELEYKLAAAEKEIDRLSAKGRELAAMSQKNMASQQSVQLHAKELEVFRKEKAAVLEQLALSRDILKDRVELAEDRFGKDVSPGQTPKEGLVKATSAGYILWMNPDLRDGVKLPKDAELFQIGNLNPMIIRAQVHEIETQKLSPGDMAKVVFDSIPGREFTASVSRIPWAPMPAALQQPSYYEIELSIPNPDLILKEGLKGQVTVLPGK